MLRARVKMELLLSKTVTADLRAWVMLWIL